MTALCATCSAPIDRDWRRQTAIVLGREASTCAACTLGTAKRSKRNWRGVVLALAIAAALAFFLLGCKTEHHGASSSISLCQEGVALPRSFSTGRPKTQVRESLVRVKRRGGLHGGPLAADRFLGRGDA